MDMNEGWNLHQVEITVHKLKLQEICIISFLFKPIFSYIFLAAYMKYVTVSWVTVINKMRKLIYVIKRMKKI